MLAIISLRFLPSRSLYSHFLSITDWSSLLPDREREEGRSATFTSFSPVEFSVALRTSIPRSLFPSVHPSLSSSSSQPIASMRVAHPSCTLSQRAHHLHFFHPRHTLLPRPSLRPKHSLGIIWGPIDRRHPPPPRPLSRPPLPPAIPSLPPSPLTEIQGTRPRPQFDFSLWR